MSTVVNIILDKSGSMNMVQDATISSINEYLESLRKDKESYLITMTLFDTKVTKLYTNEPLENVKDLSRETYSPDGLTALHDAIGMTLKDAEKDVAKNTKSLVVIMTDGQENASKEYTLETVKQKVDAFTAKGNWTFAFLGANIDSYAEAAKFGILKGNTMQFTASEAGIRSASNVLYTATSGYATMDSASTDNLFSAEDKAKVEKTQ